MLEVEVIGHELLGAGAASPATIGSWCASAALARGVEEGHLAVEIVDEARIADLNAAHRGTAAPTDVLAFPIDGPGAHPGPLELGDVVVCPERTSDLREAVVHGVLHLLGMDHERDGGEMLALQARLLAHEPR
jgi:probable rRNA maturation factor